MEKPGLDFRGFFLGFDELEREKVGSKAFQLKKLQQNNFLVPSFFCISSDLHRKYFGKINDLLKGFSFSDNPQQQNAFRQNIDLLVEEIAIDEEFGRAVLGCCDFYLPGCEQFSVRSSAMVEDSKDFSFAGQFKTFLRVEKRDLQNAVVGCWKSAFSSSVLDYCIGGKVKFENLFMGVIIQEMIEADFSGVAFSSNPKGLLNELVLVLGKSTGDGVVEDKVDVTSYHYNKTDNLYYYETKNNSPVLQKEQILGLLQDMNKIESLYDFPIDVEFAMKDNVTYFLQARPITTLKNQAKIVLDNSNIVESYPGISKPLTSSFVKQTYYDIFFGLAKRCLPNRKILLENEQILKDMIAEVNGRLYYKISNWYSMLKFMPFQKKFIPVWQTMLGVENKEYSGKKNDVKLVHKIAIHFNIAKNLLSVNRNMLKLELEFLEARSFFDSHFHEGLSNKELISLYFSLSDRILKNWDITLLNDVYAFIFTALVKSELRKNNKEYLANKLISDITNIESMKPIEALNEIIAEVHADKGLLLELAQTRDVEAFLKSDRGIAKKLNAYIYEYGDRGLEELKLESETFRTEPKLLLDYIVDIEPKIAKNQDSKTAEELKIEADILKVKKNVFLKFYMKRAVEGISNREQSRLNRSRNFGMLRSIFLAVGKNLEFEGKIENLRDVFYLSIEEIFEQAQNETSDVKLKKIIAKRKDKELIDEKLPAYSRLIFENEVFEKTLLNIKSEFLYEDRKHLRGLPCSDGIVEAEVVVIADPKTARDIKGKILVTKMTDPGWVFLLNQAAGIVAEKGSLLSHTAIISRELKIPAIVSVKDATRILKTGDFVRLDAYTGEIEVIEK